jgi:sugar phosphate isomerase/epimerase
MAQVRGGVSHEPIGMSEFLKLERKYFSVDRRSRAISFTEEGREYYSKWFARYGFDLAQVRTAEDFLKAMEEISTALVSEARTRLRKQLREAKLKGNERLFVEGMLDLDPERMREAQRNIEDSKKMGGNVVKLSFGRRKKTT